GSYHTYSFAIHDTSNRHLPPYDILEINTVTSILCVRSHLCSKISSNHGACFPCIGAINI
ncbi:hypothetical protein BDQ17DRAFT_1253287, partial [Cyathus striatus]